MAALTLESLKARLDALAARHPYGYLDLKPGDRAQLYTWLEDLRIVCWDLTKDKPLTNEILDEAITLEREKDSWFYGARDWLDRARVFYNRVARKAEKATLQPYHEGAKTTLKNLGREATDVILAPIKGGLESVSESNDLLIGMVLLGGLYIYATTTPARVAYRKLK